MPLLPPPMAFDRSQDELGEGVLLRFTGRGAEEEAYGRNGQTDGKREGRQVRPSKSRKVGQAGGCATGVKSAGRTRANVGPQRLSAGCPQSPSGCHHLPRTTVSKCQQHCLPSHSSAFLPSIPFTNNASWKMQV